MAEGSVGTRAARSLRALRYEVRRWRDGVISDIDEAVDSPQRLTSNPRLAARVLELVPDVPDLVWGRVADGTDEMWNSNSTIAWLLVRAGLDAASLKPPAGGHALGWRAGLVVAGYNPTTSSGRTGTRASLRPVASRSAATIAAVETTVGGSPTPFTP